MNGMKIMMWTAAGALTLSACGCDLFVTERHERPVIVEQRPVVIEQRPVYVEPPRRVIVVEPAPPPVIDVRIH